MDSTYGFTRTTCACEACRDKCRHMSGMVTPADLERWRQGQPVGGSATEAGLHTFLAASPGALVLRQGVRFRIPTIVPRRWPSGRCQFLSPDERCTIHDTAPFGCAFFDCTMPTAEADARSSAALMAIYADWQQGGPYSQLWHALAAAGQVVEAPEVARQHLVHP